MIVETATLEDYESLIKLAEEVEYLFGPMVNDPNFQKALIKHINNGTAFFIREEYNAPGATLYGGLLFSDKYPIYKIGWLAVKNDKRRNGFGSRFMDRVLTVPKRPATVLVETFVEATKDGQPARIFYHEHGFEPGEIVNGAGGFPVQAFRHCIISKLRP